MATPIQPTIPPNDYQLAGAGGEFLSELRGQFGESPLLRMFDDAAIEILADYMQVYRVPAGKTLLREGEKSDFALLILSGAVNVMKSHADGGQHQIATVLPGRLIGEMSLIDGEPRFASCVAATNALVAVLARRSVLALLDEHPKLGSLLLMRLTALVSNRLRQTSAKLVDLMASAQADKAAAH
ncbi:Crp/Fnr family transcriptional regulator [Chitinimonas koreensis]|uniref:Crp/Fnr family transcriptional regulator n=1 Tax=Chitinimonas koreensis TaxID=356302 RepID=UPI00040110B7|nr:cyclic nucleotide-binding domain-containing protein [Chitinimonas koreensis]QNM97405.1 cyclic nucleotide-binding domain-containing protein [Chitinimonas koreensis]